MDLPCMRELMDQHLTSGFIGFLSHALLNVWLQRMFEVLAHVDEDLAISDPGHRELARKEACRGVGGVIKIREENSVNRQRVPEHLERERNLVIMHCPELDVGEQRGRRSRDQRRDDGARSEYQQDRAA